MTTYFIPTDDNFVEYIAKTIARNRMDEAASKEIALPLETLHKMEGPLDRIFEELWAGTDDNDVRQREAYKSDALAAIRAINLKLLTLSNEG